MDRSGYSTLSKKSEHDALGMNSLFRTMTIKLVEACVDKDKWFGFCTRVSKEQVDLMGIVVNENDALPKKLSGQAVNEYEECVYRTAVYKYLLRDFMCYYEAPTVYKSQTSGFNDSYNKCLVTANLHVVAAWLDITYENAKMLYGSRLEAIEDYTDESDMCPYLKLYVTKEGIKKVTKPRKDLDLSIKGTRVVPLFALKRGLELLFKKASEDFYDITFVKDSGQVRTVNICFNLEKLRTIYTDDCKLMTEFGEQYQGDFMNVKTLERGYIRVIEVGTNLSCGASRSINFARIIRIEKRDPDITFVNTDLDRVLDTFVRSINNINIPIKDIVEMLNIFEVGQSRQVAGRDLANVQDLEDWAKAQEMLLSTPFIKQLSLFMVGNPQWFEGYTGDDRVQEPEIQPQSGSFESTSDSFCDIDLEFEL